MTTRRAEYEVRNNEELQRFRLQNSLATPRRYSALPRPFLRWVGSKQALLPQLREVLPLEFGRYYEPFLGGGALFFYMKPQSAVLSDMSGELIQTWCAVRDHVSTLADYLRPLKPDKNLFYMIREARSEDPVIRAAEFLYLNKTCWNGLYRVNGKGKFNVPYGKPRTEFIFDEENLQECSRVLSSGQVKIINSDFEPSVEGAVSGDFVYFDPPYVTKHNNNGFRDWNEKLFSWEDQVRLSVVAEQLRRRGVKVIVSNASHADVLELYPNFDKIIFERSSTLSGASNFRGRVGEVILVANAR